MPAFYARDFVEYFTIICENLNDKYFYHNGRNISYNQVLRNINKPKIMECIIRSYAFNKYGLYDSSVDQDNIRMLTEDIMYNPSSLIIYYYINSGYNF